MSEITSQRRVLLIEDDRPMATSLATFLLVAGLEVEMAFDGESAVEIAESFRPDVCLVDLNVPRLNIYDFGRCLREKLDRPPLLANVTPFADRDEWDADAEFDIEFAKPTDPMEVATQVIAFLRNDLPTQGSTRTAHAGKLRMPRFGR